MRSEPRFEFRRVGNRERVWPRRWRHRNGCWSYQSPTLPNRVLIAPWYRALPERLLHMLEWSLQWVRTGLGLSHFQIGAYSPGPLEGWTWPWIEFRWRWNEYRMPKTNAPYPKFILRYTPLSRFWWETWLRNL